MVSALAHCIPFLLLQTGTGLLDESDDAPAIVQHGQMSDFGV